MRLPPAAGRECRQPGEAIDREIRPYSRTDMRFSPKKEQNTEVCRNSREEKRKQGKTHRKLPEERQETGNEKDSDYQFGYGSRAGRCAVRVRVEIGPNSVRCHGDTGDGTVYSDSDSGCGSAFPGCEHPDTGAHSPAFRGTEPGTGDCGTRAHGGADTDTDTHTHTETGFDPGSCGIDRTSRCDKEPHRRNGGTGRFLLVCGKV